MSNEQKKLESSHLEHRTKNFSIAIIRLFESLPKSTVGQVLGKQLLRSGTSVGAQYREAKRARSRAEFAAKVDCAVQELDETTYWFELIIESRLVQQKSIEPLQHEAGELIAMLIASSKTAKMNNQKSGR